MATNDFLPFAWDADANVLSQAAYLALTARENGFIAGVAQSAQLNKVWRQSSLTAAMLGQFLADGGLDAIDNGSITTILANYKTLVRNQSLNYKVAGGTGDAITLTLSPVPASQASLLGVPLRILCQGGNTGAVTLNVNGLGAQPVRISAGSTHTGYDLLPGALSSGVILEVVWTGFIYQVLTGPGANTVRAPSAFVMTTNAIQSIPASTVTIVTNFATTLNNLVDSTLAADRITIGPVDAGWWVITSKLIYDFPASGVMYTNVIVNKNGAEIGAGNAPGTSSIRARPQATTVYKLASGDVIRLATATDVARDLTVTAGNSVFSGFKVGG